MFKRYRCFIALTLLIVVFQQLNLNVNYVSSTPTDNRGKIINISENYYTLKTSSSKVIVYSDISLNYQDEVSFDGEYELIKSVSNSKAFNFKTYMQRQNIYYSVNAKNIKVENTNFDIRNNLLDAISKLPNAQYYNKLFLNINTQSDNSLSDLLLSSRIIIVMIINGLFSLLNKMYYDDYFYIFKLLIYLLFMLMFKNVEFYTYLIIRIMLSNINIKTFDKSFISATIILLIFPNYLFSLSFIIISLFQLLNIVSLDRSKLHSLLIMIPVLLNTNYFVDIFQIICFPLIRLYNCLLFIIGIFDLILKKNMSLFLSQYLSVFESKFILTGSMPLMVIILWIIISLKIVRKFNIMNTLMLCAVLFVNQNQLWFSPFLTYTQIYIGQGDSSLITYPFKSDVLMIDTGSSFNQSKLQSYLNFYGIKTIKHLIITHNDEDHNGNLQFLKDNYNVETIVDTKTSFDFYKLKINNYQYVSDNDNDSSLITSFAVNNFNYLLLGDISKEVESKFLDEYAYDFDIVKLAHHGSNTSTSNQLLENPNIKLLLNSSGLNNMYKHPHIDVLQAIKDYDHILLDTQEYGDIMIKHFLNLSYVSISK